jgi:hypothetical protein
MIELLTDKTGVLAVLINVTPQSNFLCCGLAYFAGGLRGVIEVSSATETYQIKIPEPVAFVATPLTFSHSQDLYQIELHENPGIKTEKALDSTSRQ